MTKCNRLLENYIWLIAFLVQFPALAIHHSPLIGTVRAADEVLDSVIYHRPELPHPKVARVFPNDILSSWLSALGRPETDYQYHAALTILLAHNDGLEGTEAAVDPLLHTLEKPDQKPMVRLAAARALIGLDARQTAPQLLEQANAGDHDLRDLIEPALAAWKYKPAGEVWLERLHRLDTNGGNLVLAMRGLAALKEIKAASLLEEMVRSNPISWPIRLEAARTLGEIKTSGSETDAGQFATETGPSGVSARLAAAWLLRRHQGDEAVRLLQTLSKDSEPAVAVVALERLLEINPQLVLPSMDVVLASPDAKVRSLGVDALFREATVERLHLLSDKLDDPHPEVRTKARQALHDLAAKPVFRDAVIREALKVLDGQNWRGLEQAAILLGQLDHKPAATRFVELLKFNRPEVYVAAAWGLRRLDVPETLPKALDHFLSIVRWAQANQKKRQPQIQPSEGWDRQLSQLAQFMGQNLYRPAEPAFRAQVPRLRNVIVDEPIIGQETRAASVWGLGLLYEGKPDAQLVRQFEDRLKDIPKKMDPGENPRVRWMSAISLGRMNSKSSLDTLKRFHFKIPTLDPVSPACGWAIQQLTGEAPPPPGTVNLPAGTFRNWLRGVPEPKPAG
jgi:HEAT repeat protein